MKHYIILFAALVLCAASMTAQTKRSAKILNQKVAVENIKTIRADNQFFISMDLCLDELDMPANRRVVLTPTIMSGDNSVELQPIVINGTRQKVMFERRDNKKYPGAMAVTRKNGRIQSFSYQTRTDYADWIRSADIVMKEDLCGCGNTDNQETPRQWHRRLTLCRDAPTSTSPSTAPSFTPTTATTHASLPRLSTPST